MYHSLSQFILTTAAVLAIAPTLVRGQCNFNPRCTIGPNQRCPTGCSRTEFCTKTATKTLSASTRTVTQTQTQIQTGSPITVTITPSSSSTTAPACKTEVPYANLFAFPDDACKNSTDLLGIPLEDDGLVGPPTKFNTLIRNPETKYNESSCVVLPVEDGGARSIYFTVDGISGPPYASCTINLFENSDCSGNADRRSLPQGADKCLAARTNQGPWKSALYKCGYLSELCTPNEIYLRTCIKY